MRDNLRFILLIVGCIAAIVTWVLKMASPTPTNKALYNRVKAEAKRKFDVYQVLTHQPGLSELTRKRRDLQMSLKKWFSEKWVDIGRKKKTDLTSMW